MLAFGILTRLYDSLPWPGVRQHFYKLLRHQEKLAELWPLVKIAGKAIKKKKMAFDIVGLFQPLGTAFWNAIFVAFSYSSMFACNKSERGDALSLINDVIILWIQA